MSDVFVWLLLLFLEAKYLCSEAPGVGKIVAKYLCLTFSLLSVACLSQNVLVSFVIFSETVLNEKLWHVCWEVNS